ncbi:MAG: acyltransferase [Candidatus Peribacteraceae bacterium]|nr:acyltransferase [Candidatus Peribacteraceae bacterium]
MSTNYDEKSIAFSHKTRLKEIDVLKAVAILSIICGHLVSYTHIQKIGLVHGLIMVTSLGIFSFLSGFSLHYSYGEIRTKAKLVHFIIKRFLRIYPLYLVAFFTFLICFQYLKIYHNLNLNLSSIFIHSIGAHIALAPEFINPIFTLWFIGFIIICYLSYPLLVWNESNKKMILVAATIFFIFLSLRYFFNIIDITFFWFYPTFVAGVFWSRTKKFIGISDIKLIIILIVIAVITASIFIPYNLHYIWETFFDTWLGTIFNIVITNIFMLSVISISFWLLKPWINSLSKKVYGIILSIAFSSYAAYLFHRPIFALMTELTLRLNMTHNFQTFFIIFAGLPLLFVVSYFIQKVENKIRLFCHKSQKYK